ncbi:MAG: hypothetical protein AAFV33_01590 [Chloroflexota bacterium]
MTANNLPEHKHLYDVSIDVLELSEQAWSVCVRGGMRRIGDLVDFYRRGPDAMIDSRPPAFQLLTGEIKQSLIDKGYWHYVDRDADE